nr:lamin tail domain-containing protein [Halarchaeum rubridurum]
MAGCATGGTGGAGTTALDRTANGATTTGTAGAGANGTVGVGTDTGFAGTLNATVVDVADGDTVDVRLANGSEETIRLVGVDTPEVWVENTPREFRGLANTSANRDCLRGWGHEASDYTASRLSGADVTLAFDPNTDRRGYYGRLLAYVYVNGTNHNAALIDRGLARVYDDSDFSRKPAFQRAEGAAYENRTGLWTCATGATDGGTSGTDDSAGGTDDGSTNEGSADGTSASDGPIAVDVHADAAGRDDENLNDEYVVLRNTGDATLDLGGARVSDAADHVYTFPDGVTLAPGASLTLHTGTGTDGGGDYYWAAGSAVWNNGGDTVTVRAANGTTLATHTYE